MSIEPFNTLVKLVAWAFYDDFAANGDNQQKSRRVDNNRGIAVVVLDALTRRQWVREEDLAKHLKVHLKQLRRTLQFLKEEKLVTRMHRKETAKVAKTYSAAVAATADNLAAKAGEENTKLHTHSYCCLDYAQIHDVVRYRIHRMKKKLKDELDSKNTVQEYICPRCRKRYNAFDAARLICVEDESFHCESCNAELVAESDKLASRDYDDGNDNARRRHHEKFRELLQKMEVQLKPLTDHLSRIKDLEAPDYGTLQAWELRASVVAHASSADPNANECSRSGQCGTPMPFLGETKVEVTFSEVEEKGEIKSENEPMKVFPLWMIKEGMNLTNEQSEGVKQESKTEETLASMDLKDENKSVNQDDGARKLKDEHIKCYYADLVKRQREHEEATKRELGNISTDGDVGPSSSRKRQHDETGVDLNVEAVEPSGDDDGVDWEEG